MSPQLPLLKQYTWHKQKEDFLAYSFSPWLSIPIAVGLWRDSEEKNH